MSTNTRGKIYVDRTVQGALARRIMFHWCIFFVLASISLIGLEFFMGNPSLSFEERMGIVWNKYALFFVLMLAVVPSFVYDTVKLSHRFAGPILRLKASLGKLADGDEVQELKFRDGDFWMGIASDFNLVNERINSLQAQLDCRDDQESSGQEEDTLTPAGCSR